MAPGRQAIIDSTRAIIDVVDDVSLHEPGAVGLIASSKTSSGWTVLTPDEARTVAGALIRAADRSERVTRAPGQV